MAALPSIKGIAHISLYEIFKASVRMTMFSLLYKSNKEDDK